MTSSLVECIPNFSEARRLDVVDRIAAAISSVSGIQILDRSSDLDHNRTVITFAGPPDPVEVAAFRAIETAARLIDLNEHRGQHPRIGATDVVPFVPLSGVDMADCIDMARRLGRRVGTELQIPVYLYEAAAQRDDRVNLENIRRGQFEALKREIETDPERRPDFGPSKLGPAGATVIGARNPLIAFNVYLDTQDVEVARAVAKKIRQSSGGLPSVKALGLLVDGLAQVSMNLTNFRVTSVATAVGAVRAEAAVLGVGVHHSELIGMIPEEALTGAAIECLQLRQFEPEQTLERRLRDLSSSGPSARTASFLDELASPAPAPGGGSASAYAGAMGAALVAMVAGLTTGKKKYVAVEAEMQAIRVMAEKLRQELTEAVDDDAGAFEAVMGAMRLPRGTPEEEAARAAAVYAATMNAAHVPFHVAGNAVKVMELALRCARSGNLNAVSDGMSGFSMARAALTGAAYNVRINLRSLKSNESGSRMLKELRALEARAKGLEREIKIVLKERGGI